VPELRPRRGSPPTVESPGNEQVRFVKGLYRATIRRKEQLFVVEGVRLVEDALRARARPELVLVCREQLRRTPRGAALEHQVADFRWLPVSERVLDTVTDTVSPQGVIAVFPIPRLLPRLEPSPIVLVLDQVRDPGNAGTILRSAEACGIAGMVVFVDSVDAYSPKVVRAGMGAHFRITILDDMTWDRLLPLVRERPRHLAVASDGIPYDQVDWQRDSTLIIGGEADGASVAAAKAATDRITIPMSGPTESLNAAMAATILLFDAARVRRGTAGAPSIPRPLSPQVGERGARMKIGPSESGSAPERDSRIEVDPATSAPLSPPSGKKGEGERRRSRRNDD
jgi:TrmH family RNA methyltransferase